MKTLMTADKAIDLLKEGNTRFVNNTRFNRDHLQEIEATKEKQTPFAVIVSCMDSRTSPELIFDRGLGDIFSIRIAGNVITPEIIASLEYACAAVGSKAILVLGHSGCGAVLGAINKVQLGSLHTITSKIQACMHPHHSVEEVTQRNVEQGIETILEESPILKDLFSKNELKILGGIYDISTGLVTFLEVPVDVMYQLSSPTNFESALA